MKKQSGFTLIELLVVIAIIGLLSTLAVVALNNARMKARDAGRIHNVNQMRTVLDLYFDDEQGYPTAVTAGGSIIGPTSGTTYMGVVPTNPHPRNDGNCPDVEYSYTKDSASTYHITYCLGGGSGNISAGTHQATPASVINP